MTTKSKNIKKIVAREGLILLSVLFIAGCASVGSKLEIDDVKQIQAGVTTKDEVVELLGNPFNTSVTSDGKIMMLYQYTKIKSKARNFIPVVNIVTSGMNMEIQHLSILIDENDVVEKYTLNESQSDIKSGMLGV